LVAATDLFNVSIQGIGSTEGSSLPCMNPVGLAVARCLSLAIARADDGVGAVFARLDAIVPRPINIERQIRRIDFNSIVPI
jgi:hypothetical protein